MKKTLLLLLGVSLSILSIAQTETNTKKDWSKIDISSRSADHFMIQYGIDSWQGAPDSVKTSGFSRHFNFYFMLDKPFKTNPHFSVGLGAGIGTSNMFFHNTKVDIESMSSKLPFINQDSTDHFKKNKLTTIFLEVPVELRYYANPANPNKSWKAALGVKVGTLLKAYTKGKNLVNKNGASIYGPSYIVKEYDKRFIDGTMLAVTGRIGYGIISLDAGYQITSVLKDGVGPNMHKFSIGLTISGL